MADIDVWVLLFECESGVSTYAYPTYAEAEQHVYCIVHENWEYVSPDHPIPEDMQTAISMYFEAMDGAESYNISQHTVKVPDLAPVAQGLPPAAQDEVIDLTNEEVRAIRCLTKAFGAVDFVQKDLGVSGSDADYLLFSIHAKLA